MRCARPASQAGDSGTLGADVEDQQRRQRADDEEPAPIPVREGEDAKVRERGEQIADHVADLQKAAEKTAALGRQHLHRQRRAEAPFAAHRDAVERAKHEKDGEVR